MAQTYHYQTYSPETLVSYFTTQLIVCIIIFTTVILLFSKYRKNKVNELKYLIIMLTLVGIGILVGSFPLIVARVNITLEILNGIPIGNAGLYLWWTNLSYIFIAISGIYLYLFSNGVFEKPDRRYLKYYEIIVLIFILWDIYYGIFLMEPGGSSLNLGMAALFVFMQFFVWISLFIQSYKTYKRIEPSIYRIGTQLISISAAISLIAFITYGIGNLFQNTTIITILGSFYWIFIAITSFLLYLGYGIPNWWRNYLEKRINSE